jgi:FkbM family methyltransferase
MGVVRTVIRRALRVPIVLRGFLFLRKRVILARGVARLDYPGAQIQIRANTDSIIGSRLRPTAKEPWTVEWIEQHVRDGDVLYDVGANVGAYALIAARVCPGAQVVAIEPGFANYAALCDNVLRNGLAGQVTPLPLVLAEAPRIGTLTYTELAAGAALHVVDAKSQGTRRQAVLVESLDALIETFALPAPTLVKIDVDGGERAVLEGARRTLRRPELRSLIIEVEDDASDAITTELAAAGLTLARRIDRRGDEPLPGIWYGIFERRSGADEGAEAAGIG